MDWLKSLELNLWWRALLAVGVAIAVAAMAAKDRGVLLLGLGLVAIGFGEWINRPRVGEITAFWQRTWYEWRPNILGLALDALGFLLLAAGLWRVIVS